MKGRSPFNRPTAKRDALYRLLLKHDGKARWTQLKTHLKDLGWGPTTLKQVLDDLIDDKKVRKEAVAGEKGPEIWYLLTEEGKRDIVDSILADHKETIIILKEVFAMMDPVVARVLLGDLERYVEASITFDEDVYAALPKDAKLVSSSETEGEKPQREERKGGEK